MKFYKYLFALLFSLALIACLHFSPLEALGVEEERFLAENEHIAEIPEAALGDSAVFSSKQRLAKFDSGYFFLRETLDKTGTIDFMSSFDIPGNRLEINYRDVDKKLLKTDLTKGGKAPVSSELYIETDLCHLYLGQANQLVDLGEGLYQKQAVLPIEIIQNKNNTYTIKLRYQANQHAKNISWGLYSNKRLLDFESPTMRYLFQNYDLQQNAILGYQGYMYSFENRKDNTYFLIPAPYLASSFVKSGGSKMGDIMGQILLKMAAENINEQGYFPVIPRSRWLSEDYGIEGSYFDNRWNADLAITMMRSVKKQFDPELREAYKTLLSYFANHIRTNSLTTANGGLLNYDYGLPGQSIPTHISLNHQLNLINMLFEAALMENDMSYLDDAKQLIKGIEYIGTGWVKEDGALHYAYLLDGSLGLKDYDLLTYNDALITRGFMNRIEGTKSDVLAKIMERKLEWIRNNGFGHIYDK